MHVVGINLVRFSAQTFKDNCS